MDPLRLGFLSCPKSGDLFCLVVIRCRKALRRFLIGDPAHGFRKHGGNVDRSDFIACCHIRAWHDGVGHNHFAQHAIGDALNSRVGQNAVGTVGGNRPRTALHQCQGRVAQGACCIDDVINQNTVFARNVPDDIHDDALVRTRTTLVNNAQFHVQQLGNPAGTDNAANIRQETIMTSPSCLA